DTRNPRIVDDAPDPLVADEQCLEDAIVESGAAKKTFDGERTARDGGCMLEQDHVTGHQRRRGETEGLPQGEVPGHDRQNRTEGKAPYEALGYIGCDDLVGKVTRAVLHVTATGPRALFDLRNRAGDWLTHLERHPTGERDGLRLEKLRS